MVAHLEKTYKERCIQLLAQYNTTQKLNQMSESVVLMLLVCQEAQCCDRFSGEPVPVPNHTQWKIKSIIQMPVEHWQVWSISHLTRKPVPSVHHSHGKEMFPNIQYPTILPRAVLCHSHTSYHWLPGRRDQHLPLCFPSMGSCRELLTSSNEDYKYLVVKRTLNGLGECLMPISHGGLWYFLV